MTVQFKNIKSYLFPTVLLVSIFLGGATGYYWGDKIQWLKPFGDIFLNLIFTAIVPLIFFSVSCAIAQIDSLHKLGKIIAYMFLVFLFTGTIAAVYTLVIVKLFPLSQAVSLQLTGDKITASVNLVHQIAHIFTVPSFEKLLSHEHILALIIFAILVGVSVTKNKEKTRLFAMLLQSAENVFMQMFSLIMYYAPLGFFAYFAVLVSELGPKLMQSYIQIAVIYYLFGFIYFLSAFTFYSFLAGRLEGIKLFWKNVFLSMTTAFATCSSAASIPANLLATKRMKVPPEIYETTIPLGAILHKDGSVIGGMMKIAFLFGVLNLNFTGLTVLLTAFVVSLMVGTVMGAVPSGGMLGELLILSVYGFPPSVLLVIATISIIIDPLATMLNVTGDSVSSMMIARLVEGKKWLSSEDNEYIEEFN